MLLRTMSVLTLIFSFIFVSCAPKHSDIVLSKFGAKEIKMGEFESVYAKNAGSYEQAKSDSLSKLKSFLDLYTYFQMKLRDADVRGYSKDTSLTSELNDYKRKVGVTYIEEKQLIEPAIKKLYERRKYEMRVSHILFRPDTNAAAAKKLANEVLERIKKGESFDELCAKYSQDTYTKDIGGDIGFVTAGLLTTEFDDAIYNTPAGTVNPEVLKTRWGFHIIRVTDKRVRIPQIRASHIMAGFTSETGSTDTAAAKMRIDSVYNMLKAGKDFAELARKYSNDSGAKENGGDLGFFERRKMIKEFDEAAFNLKVGEFSNIIKTQYGFHIIKVTDQKPYPSFESNKEELKRIYKQVAYNADRDSLIEQLKTKYNFKLNDELFKQIVTKNDSARLTPEFFDSKLGKSVKGKTLFTVLDKNYTADTVFALTVNISELANRLIDSLQLNNMLKKVVPDIVLTEEALNYDKANPEFASLMEDYKNGIYIFKLQDEEVWGKIVLDSAKLVNFYNKTKENYVMPERVSYDEIYVSGDSLKTVIINLLKSGQSFESVAEKYSEKKGEDKKVLNVSLTEVNANELTAAANKLKKIGDFSDPVANNSGYSVVRLTAKEGTRLKTFEEAKAEVSGAFQEAEGKRLDAEYLEHLKNLYKPVFYYENLEKAYKAE